MKIALAQLNYHVGNFEANTQKILHSIGQARKDAADLVVFSELCICGYPPKDLLEFPKFIDLCEQALSVICEACKDIACIVGLPSRNTLRGGKSLLNSAYFIENGNVKAVVHKAILPAYDAFNECRYFEPSPHVNCIDFKGHCIALTIGKDLWSRSDKPMDVNSPMEQLIKAQPTLIINIAASPFSYRHDQNRAKILSYNGSKYKLPLLYLNHVGAQTELIFDGGSMAYNAEGELIHKMQRFEEDYHVYEISDVDGSILGSQSFMPFPDFDTEQIYKALVLGIQDYFQKSGFQKAVIGLSGGLDSAVVCALAVQALGAEHVLGLLMPSKYSSDHSIKDALELADNLACKHETLPMQQAADGFYEILKPLFLNLPFGVAEENIQARVRATILMAVSNKFGHVLLNTSNKSECAVGYGTLYGDITGALSVLGDVYKTQVFQLAKYINRASTIIPQNTITKPPSAELRPEQKDTDSLPPYDVLDHILLQHIEYKKSPEEIIAQGFDAELVKRILRMINIAEFKRHQAPPILRVSPRAFGTDRSMPIVAKYFG